MKWKPKNLYELLKNDKLRNILVIAGMFGIILIAASSFFSSKEKEEPVPDTSEYISVPEYETGLEDKLKHIITAITGEDNVAVMVTLESDSRYVYAQDNVKKQEENKSYDGSEIKESREGNDSETSLIVLKDKDGTQQALKVTEIKPEIKGVVIVSKKADDPLYKEKILEAAKTALGVSMSKVCVVGASG